MALERAQRRLGGDDGPPYRLDHCPDRPAFANGKLGLDLGKALDLCAVPESRMMVAVSEETDAAILCFGEVSRGNLAKTNISALS